MKRLAEHLADGGALREDVTKEQAFDALWVLTSFEELDLLVTGRRMSLDRAIDNLVTMAERSVCRSSTARTKRSRS